MAATIIRAVSDALLPRAIPPAVQALLAKAMRIDDIDQLHSRLASSPDEWISGVLQHLRVQLQVAREDLSRVPAAGPVVIVANHPTGVLDGLALPSVLRAIRRDVKIIGNRILTAAPETAGLVIPVDVRSGPGARRHNARGLRQALAHLAAGGVLIVFPSGEVSRFRWPTRDIADRDWMPEVARLIKRALRARPELCIVPVYIGARNSIGFHLAGALHPAVQTAMLARELLNKRGATVRVRVGHAVRGSKLATVESDRDAIDYLRWRTYLLANRQDFKARSSRPLARRRRTPIEPVMSAVDPDTIAAEVRALPPERKLSASDGLEAYAASAMEIPNLLTEIGRLREITFRGAGEGTGRPCDLDRFDAHYLHLFVWNESKREVAGAYRLAGTDNVYADHGLAGLYTATLFKYSETFLDRMGPALELGRSWVRPEYQRSFAPLLLLWKAIGKFVAARPHYRILFGPVSISNAYQQASRELMVSFLERRAALTEWLDLVSSRMPFVPRRSAPELERAGFDLDDLSTVVGDIEPDGRGVPVLLRHYLKLGGRLLGFNVDPDFSNALDGLIVVDLTRTEPKLLERYLGKAETAVFFAHQKGAYAA